MKVLSPERNKRREMSQSLVPVGFSTFLKLSIFNVLECEGKLALRSITMNKARGGDGIPVELFQILKDDAVKVLHSTCQQMWKTQPWPQDLKKSEEPEIKFPTSAGPWKKQESSRKTSISALLTIPKPLTVWITRNCGKF